MQDAKKTLRAEIEKNEVEHNNDIQHSVKRSEKDEQPIKESSVDVYDAQEELRLVKTRASLLHTHLQQMLQSLSMAMAHDQ